MVLTRLLLLVVFLLALASARKSPRLRPLLGWKALLPAPLLAADVGYRLYRSGPDALAFAEGGPERYLQYTLMAIAILVAAVLFLARLADRKRG